MQYNLTHPLLDFFGEQITDNGKPLTFGNVIILALMMNSPDDANLSMEEKLQKFALAQRTATALLQSSQIEYSQQEIDLIKKGANKSLTVYSFGKLCNFLKDGGA